jgi:hypothetical protein
MFELAVGVSGQPPPGHTPLFRREVPGGDRRGGLVRRIEPLGMKREIGELARPHYVFGGTRHKILDDPKLFRGSHRFMASQTSAESVESSAFDEICLGTDSCHRPQRADELFSDVKTGRAEVASLQVIIRPPKCRLRFRAASDSMPPLLALAEQEVYERESYLAAATDFVVTKGVTVVGRAPCVGCLKICAKTKQIVLKVRGKNGLNSDIQHFAVLDQTARGDRARIGLTHCVPSYGLELDSFVY